MLFGSGRAGRVAAALDAAGYRRLLDLPAVPVNNACGLRYDVTVPVHPGPADWYLRSFGVQFDLVSKRWLRQGRLWYSLGWGLVDRAEVTELLLVQAWPRASGHLPDKVAGVRPLAHRWLSDTGADGCVRVAAVLDSTDGAADD